MLAHSKKRTPGGMLLTSAVSILVIVLLAGAAVALGLIHRTPGVVATTEIRIWLTVVAVVAAMLGVVAIGSIVYGRSTLPLAEINRGLEDEVAGRVQQALKARNAMIFGLAKLAEYRDTDTGSHLERICSYSTILARSLEPYFIEIDERWIQRLNIAASLHDIGKVGIPDRILLKPGKLTDEERDIMMKHPLIGADTLIAIRGQLGDDPLLNLSIQVALGHHEWWDGNGYPYRLSGEQIPLAARIVALADVYDALTTERVYKKAMTHERARTIIVDARGRQFDERMVDAFLREEDDFDRVRRLHSEAPVATHLERYAA